MRDQKPPELTTRAVLELLDDMIVHQRDKCLKIARRLNSNLTPDDIMNSFDWPELRENPQYVWEDGLVAGLEAAHAAISAEFREVDPGYKIRRFSTEDDPNS